VAVGIVKADTVAEGLCQLIEFQLEARFIQARSHCLDPTFVGNAGQDSRHRLDDGQAPTT